MGHKISVLNLVKVIESLDYVKKTNVEVINDYAVRGGIVDIFSPMYENPLRIEIFDDTIAVSYTHLTLPTKRIV